MPLLWPKSDWHLCFCRKRWHHDPEIEEKNSFSVDIMTLIILSWSSLLNNISRRSKSPWTAGHSMKLRVLRKTGRSSFTDKAWLLDIDDILLNHDEYHGIHEDYLEALALRCRNVECLFTVFSPNTVLLFRLLKKGKWNLNCLGPSLILGPHLDWLIFHSEPMDQLFTQYFRHSLWISISIFASYK